MKINDFNFAFSMEILGFSMETRNFPWKLGFFVGNCWPWKTKWRKSFHISMEIWLWKQLSKEGPTKDEPLAMFFKSKKMFS